MAIFDQQTDPLAGQQIISPINTSQVVAPITVNPADVYSASNIVSAASGTSSDPYDLLNIRSNIYNTLGVNEAQKSYNEQMAKLTNLQNTSDAQQLSLGNQTVNLNAIRGEQATAQNLANYGINAQARAIDVYANKLNALKAEADIQYSIRAQEVQDTKNIMLQYPGAKIKYGDSINTITSKLTDYAKEQKKEAEKDAYKDALRALGLKTSGSRKELEKRLTKANKKAKSQADKVASLQLEQLQLSINNSRSILNQRNTATSTNNNPESYFTNSSNQSSGTPNDALGAFGY